MGAPRSRCPRRVKRRCTVSARGRRTAPPACVMAPAIDGLGAVAALLGSTQHHGTGSENTISDEKDLAFVDGQRCRPRRPLWRLGGQFGPNHTHAFPLVRHCPPSGDCHRYGPVGVIGQCCSLSSEKRGFWGCDLLRRGRHHVARHGVSAGRSNSNGVG